MAVLVQLLQRKKSNYQEKLDAANSVMAVEKIPHYLQEDVHDYLRSTQETRDNQEEFDKFLDQIAPSLKVKV